MAEKRVVRITNKKTGTVYLYEDRPYWDKDKKRPAHERKCIGKIGPDGSAEYNGYYRDREKIQVLERKAGTPAAASRTTLVGQRMILDMKNPEPRYKGSGFSVIIHRFLTRSPEFRGVGDNNFIVNYLQECFADPAGYCAATCMSFCTK